SSNKDKMDKIFEKIKDGLGKLELGDEFSTPMMVLVDPKTSLKLVEPYAITNTSTSSNIYSSTDSWEDFLIKTIKAVNNRQEVYIQTSNLLSNQILIYPLNSELIKFKPSKYMLPMPNEQVDKDSTDIAHSYIDFVLGGLIATAKSILRVDIKQS
ncbi:Putative cytosolic protein, partial (plasmid) [Borrelia coriaceae ATCC 43381]